MVVLPSKGTGAYSVPIKEANRHLREIPLLQLQVPGARGYEPRLRGYSQKLGQRKHVVKVASVPPKMDVVTQLHQPNRDDQKKVMATACVVPPLDGLPLRKMEQVQPLASCVSVLP